MSDSSPRSASTASGASASRVPLSTLAVAISLIALSFVGAVPVESWVEEVTALADGDLARDIVRDLARGWSALAGIAAVGAVAALTHRRAGSAAWAALGIAVLALGTRVLKMLAIHIRVGDTYASEPPPLPWEGIASYHADLFLFAAKWTLPAFAVLVALALLMLRRPSREGASPGAESAPEPQAADGEP